MITTLAEEGSWRAASGDCALIGELLVSVLLSGNARGPSWWRGWRHGRLVPLASATDISDVRDLSNPRRRGAGEELAAQEPGLFGPRALTASSTEPKRWSSPIRVSRPLRRRPSRACSPARATANATWLRSS